MLYCNQGAPEECSIVRYSKGIGILLFSFKWQDEDAFFRDYAASHKKLSELCFISPSRLALKVSVGVVAAAVAILSYYYEVHRRFT